MTRNLLILAMRATGGHQAQAQARRVSWFGTCSRIIGTALQPASRRWKTINRRCQ